MNQNRSFLVTLLLAVGSGAVIGLFAFGLSGKDAPSAPTAAPAPAATASVPVPAPSTASSQPGPQSEPMPPVQYDNPDATNGAAPPSDGGMIAPPGQPAIR